MTDASGEADQNTGRAPGHTARLPVIEHGHGQTGRSILLNLLIELARRDGRAPLVAIGDQRDPTLAGRRVRGASACAGTPAEGASDVKDWIATLIAQADEPRVVPLIEMGGGDWLSGRDGFEL